MRRSASGSTAGDDPATLVEECNTGMERVGRLYEQGTYYISALIMAGEIIREAAELLIPRIEAARTEGGGGKMVIATVRGDIHDIGKNIVVALLDADGVTMVDLGVNVPPEQIADAVERERPDVLGLSCLLTSGYEALGETIELVREQSAAWHPHLPIVLGGAAVDEMVNERLGADGWCADAARGLGFVRTLLAYTERPRRARNERRRGSLRTPAAVSAPDPERGSASLRERHVVACVTPARRT